uniref:Uncharacterized protein n=1 Tax=Sinocyclocheilus grahami TaxID=75366 RepID=A0A672NJE3_SINGR
MSDWKNAFLRNRVIPPHSQTDRQAPGSSQGLQLVFKQIDGLHVKQMFIHAMEKRVWQGVRIGCNNGTIFYNSQCMYSATINQ